MKQLKFAELEKRFLEAIKKAVFLNMKITY